MERYEKYKESGFDWIGEIPEHWEVKKIKYLIEDHSGNGFPNREQGKKGLEYPFYKVSDINKNSMFVDKANNYVSLETIEENKWNIIPKHSVIAAKIGEALRKNHRKITKLDCLIDNNCIGLEPNGIDYKFNFYFQSLIDFDWFVNPGAVPSLSVEKYKQFKVAIPKNIKEQTTIANYLDRKTAEIDELINQKEQLLKLYEEEKTAIINQAVTKGLTADGKGLNDYADNNKSINEISKSNKSTVQRVKMKDSGIDWLGEIPEHWEVKKLKYLGKIKYGLGQPPKLKYDGLPLIRATNIFRGRIDENDMIFVDPEDIPYDRDPVLKEFDIIVVRSGAYTADSAIIPKKYEGAITGYDMVFRSNSNYQPEFISFVMLSNYVLNNQLIPQSLRAAQPHLNREELGETLIFIPSKKVQSQIVQYIETEINRINIKAEKTKKLIDLLGEYKQSLISEVVTGKIKVV